MCASACIAYCTILLNFIIFMVLLLLLPFFIFCYSSLLFYLHYLYYPQVIMIAKQIGSMSNIKLLVIDTENKFVSTGVAKEIANAAGGR